MILIYIDESGDTGHNLSDKQQPVFVLGALIVPQSKWKEPTLKTDNLIEQGFFVDSSKSKAVQLVDLALYYVRKYEESKLGYKVSTHHRETFDCLGNFCESLRVHGRSKDILDWVETNVMGQKK